LKWKIHFDRSKNLEEFSVIQCKNKLGLSKKYPTIFFPMLSNGERVGKLSIVLEGAFMNIFVAA
jgi:hypothetical protein